MGLMIGNREDAALALDIYRSGDHEHVLSYDGTDRMVYMINEVVYKVELGQCGFNRSEYENYMRLKDTLEDGIAFPVTNIFTIDNDEVIAMQYIEGEALAECYCIEGEEHFRCLPYDISDKVSKYIDDTGGANVIESNGIYYIIDIAI